MSNDELHVIVIDEDGKITGIVGEILEVFEGLQASDAKDSEGNQTTMLIKLDTTQTTSSGQPRFTTSKQEAHFTVVQLLTT